MRPRLLLPALLLALQAVPGIARAQSGSRAALRGDVDRDGEVTAADAFSILSASIGKTPPSGYRLMPNGDADANGRISISDVLLVLGYSVGRDLKDAPVGKPLVSVSLAADSGSIETGHSTALRATLTGATDTAVIWRSSAPDIAEVDSMGKVQGRRPGTATLFAISRADTLSQAWLALAVKAAQVVSLTVSPASTVVATVGQTVQFSATAVDDQGHTVSQPLTWTSADSTLARVDGTGKVTALRPGTTTIRASGGGKSAAASVQVRSAVVAFLSVSPASVSLAVGEKVTLSATPSDSAGAALAGRTVGWSSSNPAVATVAALTSLSSSGSVSAVAPGTAVITATSEGKTASVTVTVPTTPAAAVASLTIAPVTTTLRSLGEAAQLSAKLYDASGALLTGRSVSWTSSDTSVAVVDAAGKVTARSNGTAKVTASAEGKSAADSVVVSQAVASLALSPVSATVAVGDTAQLSAFARDAGGSVVSGTDFTWTSSNPSIATVSAAGVVMGVAAGSAMVTAAQGAKSASLTVRVTAVAAAPADSVAPADPVPDTVLLTPAADSISALGQTVQLLATVKDGTGNVLDGQTITWSSSNPAMASVSASGLVTALANGNVSITAVAGSATGIAHLVVSQRAASLSISPATVQFTALGDSISLAAVAKDATGHSLSNCSATWLSTNPTVAIVKNSGWVVARAVGAAMVLASCGSMTDSVGVDVRQEIASVVVTPSSPAVSVGDTAHLAATAKDAAGTVVAGASFSWTSSNTAIATVDADGDVYARSAGTANITASANGRSALTPITVKPTESAPVTGVGPGDVVVYPSEDVAFILGPQLKAGSSANPWPWFDQNEIARGLVHGAAFPAAFDSTAFGDAVMNQQYYDLGLVEYLAYYRTGDTRFLQNARSITDVWMQGLKWRQVKWGGTSPRNSSLGGVILRALDGKPEYWPWITNYTRTMFQMWVGARVAYPELYYGVRDGGYMLLYAAWLAKVHPDPAVREEFRQKALTAGRDYYARLQKPNGAWYWKDGAVASLGDEEEPFMIGLLLDALIATHRLTGDASIAQAITKSADHMWSIYRKDVSVPEKPQVTWRAVPYFDFPDGSIKAEANLAGGWDTNTIREGRQRNSLIVQAFGYAYQLTHDVKYRQEGDEMFAATYGKGVGPLSDPYYGLGDFREKEYNQAYRSAGRYLAWRQDP